MSCPHCGGELAHGSDAGDVAIADAIEHGDELRAEAEADAQDEMTERTRIEADAAVAIAEAQADAAVAIAEADAEADVEVARAEVAIAEAQADAAGELAEAAEDLAELDDAGGVDQVDEGQAEMPGDDEEVIAVEVPPQITEEHDRPSGRRQPRTTSAFHARRMGRR